MNFDLDHEDDVDGYTLLFWTALSECSLQSYLIRSFSPEFEGEDWTLIWCRSLSPLKEQREERI